MISKEKSLISKLLPHAIAIVAFLIITIVYFSPVFQGKVLPQHDNTQYIGSSQEIREYYYNEGQTSEWLGSMFSGMPAYQVGVMGGSPIFLEYLEMPFRALGYTSAGPMFMGMLMAYLLFSIMGFRPSIAAVGAIAYSLSSYNIIIITAGHVTKAWAIAYMPLIIAGMMALLKQKILLSGLLVALGLALQIKSNHLQITYYTGLLCAFIYIYYAIDTLRKKNIKTFLKASGILAAALVIALLCNLSSLYANYEMGKTSIRGKSDLTISLNPKSDTETVDNGRDKDKDYAFAWSYGKGETLTLLIPNLYGGASKGYDESSASYKSLLSSGVPIESAQQIRQQIPQYWGDQSFTSGPVYFGAIVCFLFILGMIIIKDKLKWAFFAATAFFLFLSWGSNFEAFNDWFYYHFPLYSKFRAVSMALVIPALTMLIVAIWGLKEFLNGEEVDKKHLTKALYISGGIVAFLCFILWLAPTTFFNFTSASDSMWRDQLPDTYYNAILKDRKALLSADALRSLIFIVLTMGVLWASLKSKSNKNTIATFASLSIAVLILVDLWGIDRRYLNSDNFENKDTYQASEFKKTVADDAILRDQSPSYRVLKTGSPFNDGLTSYYHKSIGGYHAAKLKRYQEMIELRLGSEVAYVQNIAGQTFNNEYKKMQEASQQGLNPDVNQLVVSIQDSVSPIFRETAIINMLNTKYVIYHPELPPIVNPYAMGNAWFVNEINFANTPDDEILSLKTIQPHQTAVLNKNNESELASLKIAPDSSATIELTEYKPNRLTYKSKTASDQFAVFSEVYYGNGWQAYIDGEKVPHYCTDWTLRGMPIPAGEHEVVFKFEPHDYWTCRYIASASSAVMVLLVLGSLGLMISRGIKSTERKDEKITK